MYKKRIMAIVISAIMVFSVFSTTVFAEETSVDSWDGTDRYIMVSRRYFRVSFDYCRTACGTGRIGKQRYKI